MGSSIGTEPSLISGSRDAALGNAGRSNCQYIATADLENAAAVGLLDVNTCPVERNVHSVSNNAR